MALQAQFGPQYNDRYKFRQDFKEALGKVLAVYRGANVDLPHGGTLTLRRSDPPVMPTTLQGRIGLSGSA
jgi:hypothetical protein